VKAECQRPYDFASFENRAADPKIIGGGTIGQTTRSDVE
jgi:hypothetical protein